MEHLRHFGLSDDPFRNELRARDYFDTPASSDALARLERGIRQGRGLLLFTGDVGAGKSLVLRQLLDRIEEEVFEASLVVVLSAEANLRWLLTRFAKHLGVEEPAGERDALLAQVYEQLAIVREEGRHAVLIVDDADALAAGGALADACGLLKLEYEERRLFTLVLAGGQKLAQAVAADDSLRDRVELNVAMRPLDAAAGGAYLQQRLARAGGASSLFEPSALTALCEAAGGRPGLINVLADNALYEAWSAGRRSVAPADLARARADLGWNAPRSGAARPSPAPAANGAPLTTEATVLLAGDLDSDLDAVFATTGPQGIASRMPSEGPPKDEDEEDLVVALLED